jgi:hypothetical protein
LRETQTDRIARRSYAGRIDFVRFTLTSNFHRTHRGEIMADIAMTDETFSLAVVFRKAFAVYIRRFVPFVILTVIASIPNYVTIFAVPAPDSTSPPDLALARMLMVTAVVTMVTSSLAGGAVIYGVVQDLRGRAFSVSDSLLVALRRLLPILGVSFCTAIVFVLGLMLLVIPGVIFICMFLVSPHACVVERTGVFTSLSRSRFLTKGHRWQVFGLFLLMAIVAIIGDLIARTIFAPTGPSGSLIAGEVFAAIVGAFNGVLLSVLYFQLRIAKEGVDIDKIASVFD